MVEYEILPIENLKEHNLILIGKYKQTKYIIQKKDINTFLKKMGLGK